MLLPDSFAKVFKDGLCYVYNKYSINLDPDFVGTEEECDKFISQEYKFEEDFNNEMDKWLFK